MLNLLAFNNYGWLFVSDKRMATGAIDGGAVGAEPAGIAECCNGDEVKQGVVGFVC